VGRIPGEAHGLQPVGFDLVLFALFWLGVISEKNRSLIFPEQQ
jgi:hypothetical protein